jgi:hypothetical protein
MTKKLLFVFTILLVVAFVATAADATGQWVFGQPGKQAVLTLKVDGGKLTGSVVRPGDATETQIAEGKVNGDNIYFKLTLLMRGASVTSEYSGPVSGKEIQFKVTRPGPDGAPQSKTETWTRK